MAPAVNGLLRVFEGIDGSGNSTQARLLYEALRRRLIPVVLSQAPTDSPYGRKLRRLAQAGRDTLSPREECALFVEDRKIHVHDLIAPRLGAGEIVILDRYYFSTMAYQGALGLDPLKIRRENERFSPRPDRLFLIETPVALGLERIRTQRGEVPNLYEKEHYLEQVAAIFTTLHDGFIVHLDGRDTVASIHAAVMTHIEPQLRKIGAIG
mgnify:CR=1 FL=1